MSVLFRRRDIARAVVGDLPPAAEDRLRAHLGRCAACRAFYDHLAQLADAASGVAGADGRASRRAAAREAERLARALGDAAPPAPGVERPVRTARPPGRRWLLAGLALAPVAIVLLWLRHTPPAPPPDVPAPEIALRGDPGTDASVDGPALVVYASRRTDAGGRAPLRLVGELPGSGTLRVSRGDYLQFGVRALPRAAAVSVVAQPEVAGGATHVFLPRAGTPPPLAPPGARPTTIGPSFDLGRAPAAGRYTVTARFAPATADAAMDGARAEVSGLLIIEP